MAKLSVDNQIASPWPHDLLLTTKLYIPRVRPTQSLVPRPRLTQKLHQALQMGHKLTLITAPPGFGKTTLLAEWIPQSPRCVAWVSLDDRDNDPTRFLTYFIAALQTLRDDLGQPVLASLQASQPPPLETLLTALVNEINAFPDEFALVLDDYHLVQNQTVHNAIAFLLNQLPRHMHLIITGRATPPLPLARLRARGLLTELRAADLRFTLAETTRLLNEITGLQLAPTEIEALEARTEGWIAGVQMAALSMQGRDKADVHQFIKQFTGDHRYILDYLAEEVLHQQPEHIKTFLLKTSILEQLSGPLCDAIVGKENSLPDGQTMLEKLEQANLFLMPLDDQRHWYRYHYLFANFLRERLERQMSPSGLAPLYRRASHWYEQNGSLDEAITYALAGQDWNRAVGLVEQVAMTTWKIDSHLRLKRWLDLLPQEILRASPQLCLWYAWVLVIEGQLQAYEDTLQIAERAWQAAKNRMKLAEIALVRALVSYFRADGPRLLNYARQAVADLPQDQLFLRSLATYFIAQSYLLSGRPDKARQILQEAEILARTTDSPQLLVMINSGLAELALLQGQLHLASQISQGVLQKIGDHPFSLFKCKALTHLGNLNLEWGELDQAEQYLHQVLQLVSQAGQQLYSISAYTTLARLYWAQGKKNDAFQTINRALGLAQQLGSERILAELQAQQMRLRLAQGTLSLVVHWAEEHNLTPSDKPTYEKQGQYLVLVRLLISQNRPREVFPLLEHLLVLAEETDRTGQIIEILLLKALAYQRQGNSTRAVRVLERALQLAQPEGYVRLFVEEGPVVATLLRQITSNQIEPDYLRRLIAPFGDQPDTSPVGSSHPFVEPLSERELEVLKMIAQGSTNPEIAHRLMISINTVKKHATNIYSKLGVSNRTKAGALAQELGIFKNDLPF